MDRIWPGTKCERCIEQSLPCSEPLPNAIDGEKSKAIQIGSGKNRSSDDTASEDGSFTPPVDSPQEFSGRLGLLERTHSFSDAPLQHVSQTDEKSQSSITDDQEVSDLPALGRPEHVAQERRDDDQQKQPTTSEHSRLPVHSKPRRNILGNYLAETVPNLEMSQGYALPSPHNFGRSMLICPVCRKSVKTQSELK